jgi:hypothetical protein
MPEVIIGIDAEWQSGDAANTILSYQWYGIDGDRCWSDIYYPEYDKPEDKRRLKLRQWVSLILQDEYIGRAWPTNIVLASHFSPAEMSTVADFATYKGRVDIVQGSSFVTLRNPIYMQCYDRSRNRHDVNIHIADTMLLAPDGGKSLDNLGTIIGLEKLDLPQGYAKDQMQRLREDRPTEFETYAIRDAEITARYVERIQQQCRDLGLTTRYRPITVGGLALNILTARLREEGLSYDTIMGVERSTTPAGPQRSNTTRSYTNSIADRHEDLAIKCYHGGRNECFLFGAFDEVFTDYDLEGAYSTALAAVIEPDFDNLIETTNSSDFSLDRMGYALVQWKFPATTRFPCLFVKDKDGHGLIYVLEGEGYVTSPEIDLARRMGADIKIISGVVVPPKEDGVRPFLGISKWVNEQRRKYDKTNHPFENAFYKLIGNNIYGKVAQGLKDKSRVFDTRIGSTTQLERSIITDAYAAAYVTGLVRATTSEILSLLPDDVLVGNTITDGVCTTATDEHVAKAIQGPQCQFFAGLREMITGSRNIIEKKGVSKGMVFMRTRMHASIEPEGKPILAKVNMPMGHLSNEEGDALSDEDKNRILIETFVAREWDKEWQIRSLKTARKLWDTEGDLLSEEKVQYVGMDYDMKRRPDEPEENNIGNYTEQPHLRFKTRPHRTYPEYQKARKVFDRFKEPMKIHGDLDAYLQDVDTYGDKKHKSRRKRRLLLYAEDIRDRASVGDDGIQHLDGTRLKPREVKDLVETITRGELSATGDQQRKTRSRIEKKSKTLPEGHIEVTTSVSIADVIVSERFPGYTGKALKSRSRTVQGG